VDVVIPESIETILPAGHGSREGDLLNRSDFENIQRWGIVQR
jgi:hypothetical protein